jgi:DUF1680 family protein
MWDTLNTEYGGSDAGTELYIIEQYHDYQMVDGKGYTGSWDTVHGEGTRTSKDYRSRRVYGWGHYCQIASVMEGFHHCSQTQEGAHVYFELDHLS